MIHDKKLTEAICSLTCAIRGLGEQLVNENKMMLHRIDYKLENIMSVISDFAAKQNAHNDKIDAAVTGLTEDVQTLNDKITELQNSPGGITPEDQALLDAIQARSEGIATKLEALDSLTPPKPPVA